MYSLTTGSDVYYRKLFVREFELFVSRLLPGDRRYVTVTVVFYNTLIFATTTAVRERLSRVELATLRNDAYIPLTKNTRSYSIRYREYIWPPFSSIIFSAVSAIPPKCNLFTPYTSIGREKLISKIAAQNNRLKLLYLLVQIIRNFYCYFLHKQTASVV